jgi:hypothetical protein
VGQPFILLPIFNRHPFSVANEQADLEIGRRLETCPTLYSAINGKPSGEPPCDSIES